MLNKDFLFLYGMKAHIKSPYEHARESWPPIRLLTSFFDPDNILFNYILVEIPSSGSYKGLVLNVPDSQDSQDYYFSCAMV